MNTRDEELFSSKYIKVLKRDGWYEYIHMNQGGGQAVAVLPYDLTDPLNPRIVARFEHTPCHTKGYESPSVKTEKPTYLTSITGQMDKPGKTHAEVALEELAEEAGIIAQLSDLEDLGYCYPSKASDTEVRLFAFDASKHDIGEIKGDGTAGEEGAFAKWESASFVIENGNCPMLGMMYLRLLNKKLLENYFKQLP